jgi:hypothetical protein
MRNHPLSGRRLTSSQRVLPVHDHRGRQSGTTSLSSTCRRSGVLPPYGDSYFDYRYHRGVNWYRRHFPTRSDMAVAQERRFGP